MVFFHVFFQRHCRCQRSGAQQVVAAAMAVAAPFYRAMLWPVSLLRKAGKRIVFTQKRHHRFTAAVFSRKSGLFPGDALHHPEPLGLHILRLQVGRLELLEAGFGKPPDLITDLDEFLSLGLYPLGQLLCVVHVRFLLVEFFGL